MLQSICFIETHIDDEHHARRLITIKREASKQTYSVAYDSYGILPELQLQCGLE